MSSKDKVPFSKTLKGRLFIRCSLMLGILSTLVFCFIFNKIQNNMLVENDRLLNKFISFYKMYEATEEKKAYLKQYGEEGSLSKVSWVFEKLGWVLMNDGDGKENPAIYSLHDSDGEILMKSYDNLSHLIPHRELQAKNRNVFDSHFENITLENGSRYRLMFITLDKGYLLAAVSREKDFEKLAYYKNLFLVSALAMIIGALLISWIILKKATAGIERTRETADKICTDGDFSKSIPVKNEGAEVDSLIISFNKMLAKTDILIEELEQVSNNVAHDLRTPVTRMKTLAQTILLKKSDISFDEFAERVLEECEQQTGIIETVLTIAGLESESVGLNRENVELAATVSKICQLYEASAEQKGLYLKFKSDGKINCQCDKKRLERALANLIDNAVKYTDKGGVTVKAGVEKEQIFIEINDSGCGISVEEQDKVFKRFYRCDSSRSKEGNGLGLSLANAVITAHKGIIEIENKEGSGTTFKVMLPV